MNPEKDEQLRAFNVDFAEVSGSNTYATDAVGSAAPPDEKPAAAPDARARALMKLHEAGMILLTVGDVAGVRAVHGAIGVLLGATADVDEGAAREAEGAPVIALAAERARLAG